MSVVTGPDLFFHDDVVLGFIRVFRVFEIVMVVVHGHWRCGAVGKGPDDLVNTDCLIITLDCFAQLKTERRRVDFRSKGRSSCSQCDCFL